MKKLLFVSLLALAGCVNDKAETNETAAKVELSAQDKAKQNIETQILDIVKKHANDPASYQKIETRITDTIYLDKNLEKVLEFHVSNIKDQKELELEPDKKDIQQVSIIQERLDSLKSTQDSSPIFGYRFEHDYRIKNETGSLVKQTFFIATDKDFKPIELKDNYKETSAMYF